MNYNKIIGVAYLEDGHLNCLLSTIEELKLKGFIVEIYHAHKLIKDISFTNNHCATIINYNTIQKHYYNSLKKPIIYMMHGLGLWKGAGDWFLQDICLVSHEFNVKGFKETYIDKNINMTVIGFPKLDSLINKLKDRQKIKEKFIKTMKLDNTKPIIAYLPTWGDWLYELEKINFNDIPNFIIGCHNMIGVDRGSRKYNILSKAKYIYNYSNKDDLLLSADIIVGDVSSILLESLIVDVPIIHICTGSFKSFELNKTNGYNGLVTLGPVRLIERLKESIEYVLKYDDYKLLRKYWKERVLRYSDGLSSKRAADLIEKYIEKYYFEKDKKV